MKQTIEIDLKWFTFYQNNSGGHFDVDDNVAHYILVQAQNAQEANDKLSHITRDQSSSCPCCGDRWCDWLNDDDGTEKPLIYGNPVHDLVSGSFRNEARLHFYDGKIEKVVGK